SFFFYSYGHHRDLLSFPTRRSSDLDDAGFLRAGTRQRHLLGGNGGFVRETVPAATGLTGPSVRLRFRPAERAAANRISDQHDHQDRKSTRLNSSHVKISYAVFCLKK